MPEQIRDTIAGRLNLIERATERFETFLDQGQPQHARTEAALIRKHVDRVRLICGFPVAPDLDEKAL